MLLLDVSALLSPAADLVSLKGTTGFGNAVFYSLIANYLDNEIITAFNRLFTRTFQWVSGVAALLLTLWVWWQGWRIVTGQTQESMAKFFAAAAQRTFIVGLAFGASVGSSDIFYWLGNELPREVNWLVTGEDESPSSGIDENLAYMQLALSSIDVLQTGGDPAVQDAKTSSIWIAAAGTAGPAVVGGAMLLLNKIAMGLFVGFGPLFVLMLLFDYTKPLFQKWLYYGIGTIFALVMLNLMISIATEMVARVAGALWLNGFVSSLMGTGDTEGITSRALQQGGLGLILTMLIVTTPPMAAAFFNGVMGQFTPYGAFGQPSGSPPGARGPGSPPAQPGYQTQTAQAQQVRGEPMTDRPSGANPGPYSNQYSRVTDRSEAVAAPLPERAQIPGARPAEGYSSASTPASTPASALPPPSRGPSNAS
jgi:type IV secretion system protein VirB6